MGALFIIFLLIIAYKILFSRDIKGGFDNHVFWTPSPITTGLKSILRIIIIFVIVGILLACCSGI